MTYLDLALMYAARGWFVFPCAPKTKRPMIPRVDGGQGYRDATTEEAQIRAWWEKWPKCNIGIACGASNLAVLDIDLGLDGPEDFELWKAAVKLPGTFTVRTGRRTGYGIQMYFEGAVPGVDFELNGCKGQVKSIGGYVMAAESIHPDSGEAYSVYSGTQVALLPDVVRALKTPKRERDATGKMERLGVGDGRHDALTSIAGRLRNDGLEKDDLAQALVPINTAICLPGCEVPFEDLEHIAESVCRYDVPPPEPKIVFEPVAKEPERIVDWKTLFHSKGEMENAPPITFLISNFLQCEGVTAIAAPVRERKSLIALNIVHALLTGEKLFDYFEVTEKPERVLYLCPEVSLGPFTDRVKKIGLMDYVGERLFCRTMSSEGELGLGAEALWPALPGSVVVLDTAIRFLDGDENSSQDIRAFAGSVFELLRRGCRSVILLHHSPKESGDFMTLENAMRGSGDMGAFLASCWGTRLQNPSDPYKSASFMSNLKQRDFESRDFEVTSGPDCRMHIVGDPALRIVAMNARRGKPSNRDGMDDAADALIQENLKMPIRHLHQLLADKGIKRGTNWICKRRAELKVPD